MQTLIKAKKPTLKCQAAHCRNTPEDDSDFCEFHTNSETSQYYKRSVYGKQVERASNSGDVHSLVQEISLLRVLLADLLNRPGSGSALENLPLAITLLQSLNQMVTNSAKLEVFTGRFISQDEYKSLLQRVLHILTEELTDLAMIERISAKLLAIETSPPLNCKSFVDRQL